MLGLRRLRLGLQAIATSVIGQVPQSAARGIMILAVDGQSNQKGRNPGLGVGGNIAAADIAPDPRILQWPSAGPNVGALVSAAEPLWFPEEDGANPSIGPAMPMAKALLPTLAADSLIVVAPLARGGSGFLSDARWAVNGSLHQNAVARLSALKTKLAADYPTHSLELCFIGPAGEDDSGYTASAYLAAVTAAYADFRSALAMPDMMIVKARMSPAWVSTTVGGNAIDSAQIRLRERLAHVAVVDSPDGPYDPQTTNIHFNADAQVVIGRRLAAAVPLARARQAKLAPAIGFLDALSAPTAAAYSLWRRLRSAYGGSAFRLARTSDGATQDIGFDAEGLVDFAGATTFCAGTDGLIDIFYDQSGNGRNFTQNGANTRPRLVVSGQLQWRRGRPVLGGNNGSLVAGFEPSSDGCFTIAGEFSTDGSRQTLSSRSMMLYRQNGGPFTVSQHNPGTVAAGFTVATGVHVITGFPKTGGARASVDGAEQTPLATLAGTLGSYAGVTTLLARQTASGAALQAYDTSLVSELVISNAAWAADDLAKIHAASVASYRTDTV